ncbi:MAG: aminotransferase class I/II-fold pyridoxal phosphate-dependent enzyme, partial [Bacilli bacterium]|nr:aminotransferase class I/II-fold pyridoxal phosphate-dependent enzyme [Bacilli bacterium]
SELVYGKKHISIASLSGMKERTILINGFSKAFAMTGWRLGYAAGPAPLLKEMTKIHQYAIMCPPTMSQYAGIEALKNYDISVPKMVDEYEKRRNYLLSSLTKMKLPFIVPEGAFYIFVNIQEFGLTSEELALRLLNEAKVVVVPGTAFGKRGEGFIRLSYAYSVQDLEKALSRIGEWVKKERGE